jgi:hypothetical protein
VRPSMGTMLSFAADLRPLLLLICSPRINGGYLLSPNSFSNVCMTGISPFWRQYSSSFFVFSFNFILSIDVLPCFLW